MNCSGKLFRSFTIFAVWFGTSASQSACNAGDPCSFPGSGRFPGDGTGNPLQYSCLENPIDRGTWWATVHRVARVRQDLVTKHYPLPTCRERIELVPPAIPAASLKKSFPPDQVLIN